MKNIPTNLYATNGGKVTIRTWESGGDEMPRKAQNPINEFEISINNENFTVYYNRSTRKDIAYYYIKFNNRWHWTRDNIRNHTSYTT
jgi:hypothetical protein